jgi:hypothetical protein
MKMTWQPGHPIRTKQDIAEWQAWKRNSKLAAQRQRRAANRRIDYYPSDEAGAVIDSLTNHQYAGGDYSSVIDRLILSEASGISLPIKKA